MNYILLILIFIIIVFTLIIYGLYKTNSKQKHQLNKINNVDLNKNKNFFYTIIQPVVELYEKNNFILYLFLSILLYVAGSFDFGDITIINKYALKSQSISNILISAATVVLSSGVFSSITKSKHFLNIFSTEIKKIVYTEQFLSKQNNIDEIWNIVTKSVCDENFHKISDKLFEKIKLNYLPINHNFYYENYNLELHMTHETIDGTDYVIMKEVTKVDLVCDDKQLTRYCFSSNIEHLPEEEEYTYFRIDEFKVNGVDFKNTAEITNNKKDGMLAVNIECDLKGELIYSIYRSEEKRYSLKLNANRVHAARKIYNNFNLTVYHPSTVNVKFTKLGQEDNWSERECSDLGGGMKYLKTNYDGIFFQNQGYMLNFFVS